MKKLQCELCGSVDFVRTDDGMFQCQCCGCKYTIEQAKTILSGTEVRTKAIDFEVIGGVLKKYNGEDVDVVIPDTVSVIGENVFQNLAIRSVTIPNSVQEIGAEAFMNCKNLKSVTFSKELTSIGERAFYGCSSLTDIVIPEGVVTIKNGVFQNCTALTSVVFSEGIKSIDDHAFDGCVRLSTLSFPDSLQTIGKCAFQNCISLTDVLIPDDLEVEGMMFGVLQSQETFAFKGCDTTSFRNVAYWMWKDRCKHCGGKFKGLIKRVCTECGREKDY